MKKWRRGELCWPQRLKIRRHLKGTAGKSDKNGRKGEKEGEGECFKELTQMSENRSDKETKKKAEIIKKELEAHFCQEPHWGKN